MNEDLIVGLLTLCIVCLSLFVTEGVRRYKGL